MRRLLKVLAMAAAAAAAKTLSDQLPSMLDPGVGNVVAVAIAAVIGLLLPQPKK